MKRRPWLLLGGAAPLLVAAARDPLPVKRTRFIEVGAALEVDFEMPAILPLDDEQVLETVSSGFATRIVFDLALFEAGAPQSIAVRRRTVRVWWDPWSREFVVVTQDGEQPGRHQSFMRREDAVGSVARVRMGLGGTLALRRGRQHPHFVHILAQRNPRGHTAETARHARGQGRDLSVFSRWVRMFLGSAPTAELRIERRTNYFYLVKR
ncbi:MAG: hypothetical protein V3V08_22825 [Nannocystaceae bacterium]